MRILASSIGSPVNPTKLANTFKSVKRLNNITDKTIETYIGYLTDAFLIEKSERYDIKGKKYIGTTPKYYFKDLGLRNAILYIYALHPKTDVYHHVYSDILPSQGSSDWQTRCGRVKRTTLSACPQRCVGYAEEALSSCRRPVSHGDRYLGYGNTKGTVSFVRPPNFSARSDFCSFNTI